MLRQEKENYYDTRKENGMVTHVETAVTVWVQIVHENTMNDLMSLSQQLATLCPAASKISENPDTSKFYATKFSQDGIWYRCQIKQQLSPTRIRVHYVDYGNTEETDLNALVEMPATLSSVKPFAKKFVLNNIRPTKGLHDRTTINFLQTITDGKYLTCITKYPLKDKTGFYAELYDDSESISDKLISEGLATVRLSNIKPIPDVGAGDASRYGMGIARDFTAFGGSSRKESEPIRQVYDDSSNLIVKVKSNKIPNMVNGGNLDVKHKRQLDRITAEREQLSAELANIKDRMNTLQNEYTNMSARANKATLADHISSALVLAAKVKHLRKQFPVDRSALDEGIDLCNSSDRISNASVKSLAAVGSAVSVYRAAMKEICMCKNIEELQEMVEARDAARKDLYEQINTCIEEVENVPLQERIQTVQKTVVLLKKDFIPFFQFVVHEIPLLENMIPSYQQWRETKIAQFSEARECTNKSRDEVLLAFNNIQNQLSLTDDDSRGQFDLEALLGNYIKALQNEISLTDMEHGHDSGFLASMVQALEKDLQSEISNIESLQKLTIDFMQLKSEIEPWLHTYPNVSELQDIRKTLRGLRSKLRHRLADKEDVEENESDGSALAEIVEDIARIRDEIHQALTKEDNMLCNLSKLADQHFPELLTRHPDLGMDVYLTYSGLVKANYELDHFEMTPVSCDLFESLFAGESVFIREYLLSDADHVDKGEFLSQVVNYSKLSQQNLTTVKAIFFDKAARHAYVMFPKTGEMLSTFVENGQKPSEKTAQEICFNVAPALLKLHRENIIHGEVTPQNIVIAEDNSCILLMPDFSRKTIDRCRKKYVSKSGLQFVAPEIRNATETSMISPVVDMYSIGVLLLWLHCPESKFGMLPEGTLDYTSAPLDQLLKDVLSSLLLPTPNGRASIEDLLTSEYLNTDIIDEPVAAESESVSDSTASDGIPSEKLSDEIEVLNVVDTATADKTETQPEEYASDEIEEEDKTTELSKPDLLNPEESSENVDEVTPDITESEKTVSDKVEEEEEPSVFAVDSTKIDLTKIDLSKTYLNSSRPIVTDQKTSDSLEEVAVEADKGCDDQNSDESEDINNDSPDLITECIDRRMSSRNQGGQSAATDEATNNLDNQHSFQENNSDSPVTVSNSVSEDSSDVL